MNLIDRMLNRHAATERLNHWAKRELPHPTEELDLRDPEPQVKVVPAPQVQYDEVESTLWTFRRYHQ